MKITDLVTRLQVHIIGNFRAGSEVELEVRIDFVHLGMNFLVRVSSKIDG